MFRKPHKVKSNTQLKSSDKKKLMNKLQSHFAFRDDDLQLLLPSKESVSSVKIIVSSQDIVTVYVCQDLPLFYEFDDALHPTIYTLWKYPLIIPHIRVYSGVTHHLLNGADLMIPGIIPNQEHLKDNNFSAGKLFYINTEKNIAAVCVGISLISSSEMVQSGNKGKAVHIYHTFGDELARMYESGGTEMYYLGDSFIDSKREDTPVETEENVEYEKSEVQEEMPSAPETVNMTMDELLLYSFIKGIKKHFSDLSFPVLTNIFYKNCMLEVVPKNMSLDIKKTKYKKLSVFLNEMDKFKIISVEDVKGVQSITSVDLAHEVFRSFVDNYKDDIKEKESPKTMEIIEKNVINSRMEFIFSHSHLRKGDSLTDQEVRRILTDYIKAENLQDPSSKEFVTLNGPLCDIIKTKDLRISWKNLFESVLSKMSKCYAIHTTDNKVISGRGKLQPIELTVAVKASNKKVTLVKNLELYGINIQEFSKECQLGVAASSTITTLPNSKSMLFQIQGNQKKFIGKLLLEKYFVPKKLIDGLEEQKSKKK